MEASTFWNELIVDFYIDDCKGDYELDDRLVIPRENLCVGMDLFDGLNRKGGWTNWGTEYVKSINVDGVDTTAGLVTMVSSVIVEVNNVMPYREGYYRISLK